MSPAPSSTEYDISNAEKGDYEAGRPLDRHLTPGGHPLDQSQPAFPVYHRKLADPAPLGLCAFALTTFVLSMFNLQVRGITIPAVVIGLTLFYGGVVQILVGMWEIAAGNTFGATVFTSYGGFWLSFGYILAPWSGAEAAYSSAPRELEAALSVYLFSWLIFSIIVTVASLRSSVALTLLLFFVDLVFLLLAIAFLYPVPDVMHAVLTRVAGGFGVLAAFNAWYIAAAGLLTPQTSYFLLPLGDRTRKD